MSHLVRPAVDGRSNAAPTPLGRVHRDQLVAITLPFVLGRLFAKLRQLLQQAGDSASGLEAGFEVVEPQAN
jgi:hypothetical protein